MSVKQLKQELQKSCQSESKVRNKTHSELYRELAGTQRNRSLVMWHDQATILGSGFLLITVHIMYNPAVFLTDTEYEEKHKIKVDIQSIVEQPEIHLLSLGSLSIADQAAVVGDRRSCLFDLPTPLTTRGVAVHDNLRVFTGDHPALQFERGTQQGGKYKCGTCGCVDKKLDDPAHSLRLNWRSLKVLQDTATSGVYGNKPGVPKPFSN